MGYCTGGDTAEMYPQQYLGRRGNVGYCKGGDTAEMDLQQYLGK